MTAGDPGWGDPHHVVEYLAALLANRERRSNTATIAAVETVIGRYHAARAEQSQERVS